MRILGAIIQVAALTVLDLRQELALSYAIALQLIGDENARHIQQPLQETLEEASRCPGVTAGLHQNVKHDAVLIDGAPEIMLFTVDPNEDLVQVPFVAGPRSTPTKTVRETRAKLQTPPPDTLVGDKDAALRQEQLDISKAQAEYVVEPDRVADQLGRKTMAIMWVWRLLHSSILAQDRAALQTNLM
jgi:hypothetical protein